jgi:hypothetical protein
MKIPSFTAEASLYQTSSHYQQQTRGASRGVSTLSTVQPAALDGGGDLTTLDAYGSGDAGLASSVAPPPPSTCGDCICQAPLKCKKGVWGNCECY